MKKLISIFISLLFFPLWADPPLENKRSPLVLVIGGGPAGLGGAIEAKLRGFDVTLVEKRPSYSRARFILLSHDSVRILKKWGADDSYLQLTDFVQSKEWIGNFFQEPNSVATMINIVEHALLHVVQKLGIDYIQGSFEGILDTQIAKISTEEEDLEIAYDYLVSAEGLHGKIKDIVGISTEKLADANAILAYIPLVNQPNHDEHIPYYKNNGEIIRIVDIKNWIKVLMYQTRFRSSIEDLKKTLASNDLLYEYDMVSKNCASIFKDISIRLERSSRYCDPKHKVLILGDVATNGSFLMGIGLNAAFYEAEAAGRFFDEVLHEENKAFQNYNQAITKISDLLIEDNMLVFPDLMSTHFQEEEETRL